MGSRKKPAPKQSAMLRNHCCASLSGCFTDYFCPLTVGLTAKSWRHLGSRNNVPPVTQDRQASQEKSGIEIAAIDAPIDGRPIPSDTHRIQSFGELPIAPRAPLHSSLNQQFSLESPIVHHFRLGFYAAGVGIQRQGTSLTYAHFRQRDFLGYVDGQLKSILSHSASSCLYLCPNYFEVRVNA